MHQKRPWKIYCSIIIIYNDISTLFESNLTKIQYFWVMHSLSSAIFVNSPYSSCRWSSVWSWIFPKYFIIQKFASQILISCFHQFAIGNPKGLFAKTISSKYFLGFTETLYPGRITIGGIIKSNGHPCISIYYIDWRNIV